MLGHHVLNYGRTALFQRNAGNVDDMDTFKMKIVEDHVGNAAQLEAR